SLLVPPALSPVKFTYCSGRTPQLSGIVPSSAQPEGGQSILLQGTDFLFGADVVFTGPGALNLTATISPPNPDITATPGSTCAAPTSTRIVLTTPPFCAGPVAVKVVNPDGVPSPPITLDYAPLVATAQSATPMTTIAGLAPPNAFVA